MSLAQVTRTPFRRRIRISVTADRMTVADVLAFADKIREEGIDALPRTYVAADRAYTTGHFCGLSIAYDETFPQPADESEVTRMSEESTEQPVEAEAEVEAEDTGETGSDEDADAES